MKRYREYLKIRCKHIDKNCPNIIEMCRLFVMLKVKYNLEKNNGYNLLIISIILINIVL